MSVICRPPGAMGMEHLSLRVGLGVAEALDAMFLALPQVSIKRPNDLFLQGKKLAGILCEARWEGPSPAWVVVGLGLNVSNRLSGEVSQVATTLVESGVEATPDLLAEPLAHAIARATLAPGPLTDAEEARIAAREYVP